MSIDDERQRRILTTHVGSLPRPDALSEMMAEGKTEGPAYAKMVREAVAAVVKRQADCGIDIVDDGEQSKPGFITYIDERLGGMEVAHRQSAAIGHARETLIPGILRPWPFGHPPAAAALHRAGPLYRPAPASRPISRI